MQTEILLEERGILTATTSRSGGVGIEVQGRDSLIAIRTPPPRDFLSLRKIA